MDYGQIIIELAPADAGRSTRLWLSGRLPTGLPRQHLRTAIRWLAKRSGWPVECVLCVGRESGRWFEWWTGSLSGIKEHHLEFHYSVRHASSDRWGEG